MAEYYRCPRCGTEFTTRSSCSFCSPCSGTVFCPSCGLMLRDRPVYLMHSYPDEE